MYLQTYKMYNILNFTVCRLSESYIKGYDKNVNT